MRRRSWLRRAAVLLAVAGVALTTTGCEALVALRFGEAREVAGLPEIPESAYLDAVGQAVIAADCSSSEFPGQVRRIDDARSFYGDEPALAVLHIGGSSPIDLDLAPDRQEIEAAEAIWAQWRDDPAITDARWDDMALAWVPCLQPDGDGGVLPYLYMALVLRDRP